jgi:biopolymer transport protein ExbD
VSYPASKSSLKLLRKVRGHRQLEALKPQLTSLVDVLTLILIYLLKSFSAEGEIVTITKDLILPASTAQKRPELKVKLTINNSVLMAEDKIVADVGEVLNSEELIIPGLNAWLQLRREATEKISKYSSKTKFTGEILILGDKRIRFRLIKKIMYTCGQQGYNNFSLVVQKKEE